MTNTQTTPITEREAARDLHSKLDITAYGSVDKLLTADGTKATTTMCRDAAVSVKQAVKDLDYMLDHELEAAPMTQAIAAEVMTPLIAFTNRYGPNGSGNPVQAPAEIRKALQQCQAAQAKLSVIHDDYEQPNALEVIREALRKGDRHGDGWYVPNHVYHRMCDAAGEPLSERQAA